MKGLSLQSLKTHPSVCILETVLSLLIILSYFNYQGHSSTIILRTVFHYNTSFSTKHFVYLAIFLEYFLAFIFRIKRILIIFPLISNKINYLASPLPLCPFLSLLKDVSFYASRKDFGIFEKCYNFDYVKYYKMLKALHVFILQC